MAEKNVEIKKVESFLSKIGITKALSEEHKEEGKKHEALLIEAVDDLQKELEELSHEKEELETNLKSAGEDMELTRQEELKLRNKIDFLVKKESELSSKKIGLQDKLNTLKSKMAKVSKIKDDLKEI